MPGPRIRTDIVEVYAFRRPAAGFPPGRAGDAEFLQLRRAPGRRLAGTFQPVMGHAVDGETAVATALRELAEETGYAPGAGLLHLWQLEEPNAYFLAADDAVVLGPCFAAEVDPGREPTLDPEHDAHRWVRRDHADRVFLWPGQRRAVAQITRDVLEPGSAVAPILRVDVG